MKIGILPLGRPTFDVGFAGQKLSQMLEKLADSDYQIVGPQALLLDEAETRVAIAGLSTASIDQLLILQMTFTDASMTVAAAAAFGQPLSIWAVPEPRLGGRLRLNAFCGLNLASHVLGLKDQVFSWLYADPSADIAGDLDALLAGQRLAGHLDAIPADEFASPDGQSVAAAIKGRRVARIGEHPAGFDTCAYSASQINALAGVSVDELALDDLFAAARSVSKADANHVRQMSDATLDGLENVNQDALDRSLRLKAGLEVIRARGHYDAFAIRCWPEMFTEYGGAVCGPIAMMGEARVPCACEADVYGALSQLVLQEVSGAPVFLTDLVDMDIDDNTAVVWHCGQAPMSMRDPEIEATATIHTNRKLPLLYQFPLRPGTVTFLRISQSFNSPKMVISLGEMLKRPMAFTGTSGVVRFDRPASKVLNDIMASGLEHHMALAYGDHRALLRGVAAAMNLPLLEI
ncbi:MAG: L-fucose/L-arabinose isomerase family protein [Paracoccaceae bacterium]